MSDVVRRVERMQIALRESLCQWKILRHRADGNRRSYQQTTGKTRLHPFHASIQPFLSIETVSRYTDLIYSWQCHSRMMSYADPDLPACVYFCPLHCVAARADQY